APSPLLVANGILAGAVAAGPGAIVWLEAGRGSGRGNASARRAAPGEDEAAPTAGDAGAGERPPLE
ncbi:MAG: hypothetical protein HY784_12670, partial [Chloroflexi bacterium]|nr:hypothetical protein [Chloroflexota bacterium]